MCWRQTENVCIFLVTTIKSWGSGLQYDSTVNCYFCGNTRNEQLTHDPMCNNNIISSRMPALVTNRELSTDSDSPVSLHTQQFRTFRCKNRAVMLKLIYIVSSLLSDVPVCGFMNFYKNDLNAGTALVIWPELYLCWISLTRVTLAERRNIPSISRPDAHRKSKIGKGALTGRPLINFCWCWFTVTLFGKEANGVPHHHRNAFAVWTSLSQPITQTQRSGSLPITGRSWSLTWNHQHQSTKGQRWLTVAVGLQTPGLGVEGCEEETWEADCLASWRLSASCHTWHRKTALLPFTHFFLDVR